MKRVHQDDLDTLFTLLIKIDPVLLVHLQVDHVVTQPREPITYQFLRQIAHVDFTMVPVVAEAAQVILVAVAEEVDVARLVLLPILEVVHSNIRIRYVTHFIYSPILVNLILLIIYYYARFFDTKLL